MRPAPLIGELEAHWLRGVAWAMPKGNFVELGVYQGGSAWHLAEVAKAQDRKLYLFDTFTGIPFQDQVDSHQTGDFCDTSSEAVAALIPSAIIVKGVFPETMIPLLPVALVHVDCDQYRSVKAACEIFPKFMVPGGVMIFDDYGQLEGATLAVDESFQRIDKSGMRAAVRF